MSAAHDRRFLERMAKEAARERLRRAQRALKAAAAHKRASVARARALCTHSKQAFAAWKREARAALKLEIAALRKQAREWPREQRAQLRGEVARRTAEVCEVCSTVNSSRKAAAAEVDDARAKLGEERRARKRERIWAAPASKLAGTGPARARERREESDHEVEVNLSPDEMIVWRSVGQRIQGTARMSRTEAFHHWMHDHSAEVSRLIEAEAEAYVVAMERELRQAERAASRKHARRTNAELAEVVRSAVPF